MKGRGFLTQCEGGSWEQYGCPDGRTTRLEKPGRWRCADCVKKYGEIEK
jgi:hypothetical protein